MQKLPPASFPGVFHANLPESAPGTKQAAFKRRPIVRAMAGHSAR